MMQHKSAPLTGLLTLFSIGFYGIHWFGQQKDFIESRGGNVPSAWLYGIVVFLLPVDIIASLWVQSKYIEQAQMLSQYFLWAGIAIACLSALIYMRYAFKYNASLDQATAGSVTSKLSILPFGLGFLGFWNLQSSVNNYHLDTIAVAPNQAPATDNASGLVTGDMNGSDWQQGIATIQAAPPSASPAQAEPILPPNNQPFQPVMPQPQPAPNQPNVPLQAPVAPNNLTGTSWQQGLNTVSEPQNQMPDLPPDPMDQPVSAQPQPAPNQPVSPYENAGPMPGAVINAQPNNQQNPYNNNSGV